MISSASSSLFVYGTLMSPQVLRVLIGRLPEMIDPATLKGYRRYPVKDQSYPGMVSGSAEDYVTGIILHELTESDLQVLDWFEGDEYTRRSVQVQCGPTILTTQTYAWSNPVSDLDTRMDWSYETFCDSLLESYLLQTVQPCRIQLDKLNIGICNEKEQ
jgi:gamma-glutamylcyclotransferase (GGCT)/AIG2-like uncharacterized protein YtfP